MYREMKSQCLPDDGCPASSQMSVTASFLFLEPDADAMQNQSDAHYSSRASTIFLPLRPSVCVLLVGVPAHVVLSALQCTDFLVLDVGCLLDLLWKMAVAGDAANFREMLIALLEHVVVLLLLLLGKTA